MGDTHTGVCRGGPLDGQTVTVKSPDFIVADKAAGIAWLYQRAGAAEFAVCLDHDNTLVYPHGTATGERAIDWGRLPLSTDALDVVSIGDTPEAYAGDPVDDGWGAASNTHQMG